jgi:hypothetical protein
MNAWTAAASIMILVSGAIATSQAQQPSTTLSPAALKEIPAAGLPVSDDTAQHGPPPQLAAHGILENDQAGL